MILPHVYANYSQIIATVGRLERCESRIFLDWKYVPIGPYENNFLPFLRIPQVKKKKKKQEKENTRKQELNFCFL